MTLPDSDRNPIWCSRLDAALTAINHAPPPPVQGTLRRAAGLTLEAAGCIAPVGARCRVHNPAQGLESGDAIETEVVGFEDDRLFLMPVGPIHGVAPNARVTPLQHAPQALVGDDLLGRVIDGTGRPLDGRGALRGGHSRPLIGEPINPLTRAPIDRPLDVGIRTINALLSVGRGQRVGLFAGSGVGKSVLLGMMTNYTAADVIVVGLIGERGREVQEFVAATLGPETLRRSVVVAAPADAPPLMRLHGAWLATTIAEYFRDCGKQVLLLMDSLTRFAQAQREIGLAIGEPPATRGFPPSVFARLPQLIERAGNGPPGSGSITGFYTVLVEGDDHNDPIADASRAILDGHVVLSRRIAEEGIYPAIDIEASISRAMHDITDETHRHRAVRLKQLYAAWQRNRDMISLGAYRSGSDPLVDEAIRRWPAIQQFLQQQRDTRVGFDTSRTALENLLRPLDADRDDAVSPA